MRHLISSAVTGLALLALSSLPILAQAPAPTTPPADPAATPGGGWLIGGGLFCW